MTTDEVEQLGMPEIVEAERKLAMISQDRQLRVEYERRRMAHHDAVSLRRDSWLDGVDEGSKRVTRQAIIDLCDVLGIGVTAAQRDQLETLRLEELDALRQHIKQQRTWPRDVSG